MSAVAFHLLENHARVQGYNTGSDHTRMVQMDVEPCAYDGRALPSGGPVTARGVPYPGSYPLPRQERHTGRRIHRAPRPR